MVVTDDEIIQWFVKHKELLDGVSDYRSIIKAYQDNILSDDDINKIIELSVNPFIENNEWDMWIALYRLDDLTILNDMDMEQIELFLKLQ